MEKKLMLLERLTIINMLPKQGTFKEMRTADAIEKKLNPTPEENQKLKIKQTGDQIHWNPEADKGTVIKFTVEEVALIASKLKELDRVGKFTREMIHLWQLFEEGMVTGATNGN